MSNRTVPFATGLLQPLIDYSNHVAGLGLEKSLIELVKIRASQVNGCAVCLSLHATEAVQQGETQERIIMLDAWRESSLFTPREKAAVAWTEALVKVSETRAPQDVYDAMAREFDDKERVMLSLLIGAINSFNMLGVGFQIAPYTETRKAAA